MPDIRTSQKGIEESGWRFTVVGDFDDVTVMADEWIELERKQAVESMKKAQRLVRDEWKKTLGKQMARKSRANEPPRRITGKLQKGVKLGSRRWRDRKLRLEGKVKNTHPAAGAFEFGAIKTLGFGPRPHYRPTLGRIREKLGRVLAGLE